MRIRQNARAAEDAINMTPLIDMVFLLLIFFLVATTFASEERDITIQLPGTSAPQALSSPPRQLIINIHEDGRIVVSNQPCSGKELAAMLRDILKSNPDKEVLIRADKRSLFQHYAGVVSICRSVGVHESKLGYLEETQTPFAIE